MQSSNQILIVSIVVLFALSCGQKNKPATQLPDYKSKEFQDKLVEANKMYVKKESDEIDQYARHKGWNMITTGTGLRYMITEKGKGIQAKTGQYARVIYKISLLDGTLCYSSDDTGPKEFLIGQDQVESGLHEGIQYLHVGDKAIFILPSHLAHGLVGDESKIPPHASVVYNVQLLSLR